MAARLLLVPAALSGRPADGLAVGHLGRRVHHLQAEPPAQAIERQVQVRLAAALDQGLLGIAPDRQAPVLLDQLVERGGQAHVVLAVLGRDGHGEQRRMPLQNRPLASLAVGRQHHPRGRRIDLGQGDDLALFAGGGLLLRAAHEGHKPSGPAPRPVRQGQFGALLEGRAERAGIGQLARLTGVGHAEHIGRGPVDPEPRRGGLGVRSLMSQRLQQPLHAEAVQRRTEEYRGDQALAHLVAEVAADAVEAGGLVVEQLFQQGVVVVGQLLQHVEAGVGLDGGGGLRQVDPLRRLPAPIDVGALQGQIDEAGDLLALQQRQLTHHHRRGADILQGVDQGVERPVRLVDAVDEDGVGNAERLQVRQDRLGQHRLARIRIDHHDGQVHRRQHRLGGAGEIAGSGTVDDAEAVAEELQTGQVQLDRHPSLPRLG